MQKISIISTAIKVCGLLSCAMGLHQLPQALLLYLMMSPYGREVLRYQLGYLLVSGIYLAAGLFLIRHSEPLAARILGRERDEALPNVVRSELLERLAVSVAGFLVAASAISTVMKGAVHLLSRPGAEFTEPLVMDSLGGALTLALGVTAFLRPGIIWRLARKGVHAGPGSEAG